MGDNLREFTKEEVQKAVAIFDQIRDMGKKKALPSEVTNWIYGYALDDRPGVFSEYSDDIISDMMMVTSPLMDWIPTESTDYVHEVAAHLSFVTAQGYDGSVSYMQHLIDSDDITECGYGDGADYNAYEYRHGLARVSFSNKDKPISRTVGLPNYKKSSRKFLRGGRAGQTISTERDWVLAMLAERLEGHIRFNLVWGNESAAPTGNKNMYDGLDKMIRQGWVASRLIGGGDPHFCDPIVVNGIALDSPITQFRIIMEVIAKEIERVQTRTGRAPAPGDIGFFCTSNHWRVYSEVIASGELTRLFDSANVLHITPGDVQRELDRVRSARGFDVNGVFIPVYIDNALGRNEDMPDGSGWATVGDCYYLTRYYRGRTILKHRYLNWASPFMEKPPEDTRNMKWPTFMNNMIRTTYGFTDTSETCWWYGMEMWAGLFSEMQPLQSKFTNFIVPAYLENVLESGDYWHQDFYAYDGERGHQGVPLITGLGEV